MKQKGITLIGMTEAGKTTLGPILAKKLGWPVYDVDEIIKKQEGNKLIGEILQEHGQEYLLELEKKCVASLDLHKSVLATPGSIVYDTACHQQLREQTKIVWLDVSLEVLKARFGRDPKKARAIVGAENGFESLFNERQPLYSRLADIRIEDSRQMTPDEIAETIIRQLNLD